MYVCIYPIRRLQLDVITYITLVTIFTDHVDINVRR